MRIIDDFFKVPDDVREYGFSYEFYNKLENENWGGVRTNRLNCDLSEKISNRVNKLLNKELSFDMYFHILRQSDMDTEEYRKKIHQDSDYSYAGLVYLTPNPPKETGTIFYQKINNEFMFDCYVENVYNRMVVYESNRYHCPAKLFGETKEDVRFTLTFFGK